MNRPAVAVEAKQDAQGSRTQHRHRPTLPDDLTRALTQAARAIRKHYRIISRSQADRAGKLFARALFPRRAGRPRSRDVTRALEMEAQGISRKEIYVRLGRRTRLQQLTLREAMRQRRLRVRRRRSRPGSFPNPLHDHGSYKHQDGDAGQ